MIKVQMKAAQEYEQPQMISIELNVEHGFSASSTLEDMKESEGEWAY